MFKLTTSCPNCGNDFQANHLYCRTCGAIPTTETENHDQEQRQSINPPSSPFVTNTATTTSTTNPVPVISNMTMERGGETNYSSSTTPTIVNSNKTFALVTKDSKNKVIESFYCCLPCPMIPCCICLCSQLKVVNANQKGEPITVQYNHETKTIRNMNRHGQFIVTEWDKSKVGTFISSWGLCGCPCFADNHQWNLMSDGSMVYARGDNVAFGKQVDEPSSSTGDAPILVNAGNFSMMRFSFDGEH